LSELRDQPFDVIHYVVLDGVEDILPNISRAKQMRLRAN